MRKCECGKMSVGFWRVRWWMNESERSVVDRTGGGGGREGL